MRTKLLPLVACFLIISSMANAQAPDNAVWLAHYNFSQKRDTTPGAKLYTEKFVLLLGKNASVYRSLDKQLNKDAMAAEVAAQAKASADQHGIVLTIHDAPNITTDEYYQYPNDGKLYTEKKLINFYVSEESMPVINWKITSDTMSFAGQRCQKATAHFKGRDYTAWFAPDLPFKNGPWKLNGLPGLIVEAYDTKKEVVFQFAGFEDRSKSADKIAVEPTDIKATPQELAQLYQAQQADPQGFARAMRGGGSKQQRNSDSNSPLNSISPGDIKSIHIVSDYTRIPINNPIELPEHK